MRGIDFSSWQSLLMTMIGLGLFMLISIGIRLLMMFTIQQRRERMNRQINERLRILIAAYKILGGSFTGTLTVDPTHLRDQKLRVQPDIENDDIETKGVAVGSSAGQTEGGVFAMLSKALYPILSCWVQKSRSACLSGRCAS